MAKLLVKDGGWKYPKSVYVKQNDRWKSAKEVWVKEGDDWKIAWPNNTGTITYTEATFGTFQVPDGIYSIEVYWPTSSTYISSATLAVTPGSQISYQIGGEGESSNFGGVTTTKFNKEVMKFRGNVDDTLKQIFNVVIPTAGSYSNYNDDNGLGAGTLSANAAAAGIGYSEPVETKHGDLPGYISLTPVVESDLLPGDFKVIFTDVNYVQGGTSIIAQQPTVSNDYTVIIFTTDPSGVPQESIHYYTINLQQRTPVSIKWGDWENASTTPIAPTSPRVYLVTPNTGTVAGGEFITINGARFTGATGATIGGVGIGSFNVSNDTLISGTTPAGSLGSKSVIVTTPGGSNSANTLFTYVDPSVSTSLLTISGALLANGLVGNSYSQTVTVSGGTAPYTWNVSGYTLVAGISLNISGDKLTIAGTPTAPGTNTIPYTITDSSGLTSIGSLGFVIGNKQVLVSPLTSTGVASSGNGYSSSGSFTVTSQGGSSQQVLVLKSVQAGSPGGAVLSTSSFTLAPGASQTVNFTATWFAGTVGEVFSWYFTAYDPVAGQNPGVDNDHIHYQTRA